MILTLSKRESEAYKQQSEIVKRHLLAILIYGYVGADVSVMDVCGRDSKISIDR